MFERSANWVNRLEYFPSIGSTNTYLEEVSTTEAAAWPDFSAVVADAQTAGRGRLDRDWLSPTGQSLAVSILLRQVSAPAWLSAVTALSLLTTLRSFSAGMPAGLKWPNDLLVGEKKLAGILVRATANAFVVGVGINLRPIPEFAVSSTSLQELGIDVTADGFLARFLAGFRARYLRMRVEPSEFVTQSRAEYQRECLTVGRRVRVELPAAGAAGAGEELLGLATGIDESGRLLVARESDFGDSAESIALAAGDVWHLRNL